MTPIEESKKYTQKQLAKLYLKTVKSRANLTRIRKCASCNKEFNNTYYGDSYDSAVAHIPNFKNIFNYDAFWRSLDICPICIEVRKLLPDE